MESKKTKNTKRKLDEAIAKIRNFDELQAFAERLYKIVTGKNQNKNGEQLLAETAVNLQTLVENLQKTAVEKRQLMLSCMDVLLTEPDLFWEDFLNQLIEERKRFARNTADYYEADEKKKRQANQTKKTAVRQ